MRKTVVGLTQNVELGVIEMEAEHVQNVGLVEMLIGPGVSRIDFGERKIHTVN